MCAFVLAVALQAQMITSGIAGRVQGTDGRPVAGATVTAVHLPTNGKFVVTTNVEGRYYFRSLPVGGPYTVTASPVGNLTEDEKQFAKIDWNVTKDHRLSVRYSTTEGQLPQYGGFTSPTGARGVNPTPKARASRLIPISTSWSVRRRSSLDSS